MKRFFVRYGKWLPLGAALVVLLLPRLLSFAPMRDWLLNTASAPLDGRIHTGGGAFGWLTTQRVEAIDVRSFSNEPLISVDSIQVERSLLKIIGNRQELGEVRIERPQLSLQLRADGSNLADVLQPRKVRPDRPVVPPPLMSLRVVDAAVTWQLPGAANSWTIEGLQLAMAIEPLPSSALNRQVVLPEQTILSHCELSLGMCRDVLHLILPELLHNAANANGDISLTIHEAHLPLEDPAGGTLSGELVFHKVEVGGGPIITRIAGLLGLHERAQLARETVVQFRLVDRRVYHEGLDFGLGPVRMRSAGSVGVDDETLDLLARIEVDVPESALAERPILRALIGKPLELPIRGTLDQPQLDAGALSGEAMNILSEVLRAVGERGQQTVAGPLERLQQLLAPPSPGDGSPAQAGSAESAPAPLATEAVDVLQQLIERRRQRLQEQQQQREAADPAQPPEGPRRPLQRLRERLRQGESTDSPENATSTD